MLVSTSSAWVWVRLKVRVKARVRVRMRAWGCLAFTSLKITARAVRCTRTIASGGIGGR